MAPKTASLVETADGHQAVCPNCQVVIFKAGDRRSVILNAEKVSQHICK